MAFYLEAIIGKESLLERLAEELPSAQVCDLTDGLALLPLTEAVKSETLTEGGSEKPPFEGLALIKDLAESAKKISKSGALAYVEGHYPEGSDHQGAIVWSDGEIVFGPLIDDSAWDPREPNENRPVNRALRTLGLQAGSYDDEWDAAGFTRHPTTEDWGS